MSAAPRKWTDQELARDVAAATAAFREQRFAEPLAAWLREVDRRTSDFTRLFEQYDAGSPHHLTAADIPSIIEAGLLDALRYLPGPPISADDLRNLADVESLNPGRLRRDISSAQRILDTIRATVDPRRFPWLAKNRGPTDGEKSAAIFASALLHAAQRLQTLRRTLAKDEQEKSVRDCLKAHKFQGERLRRIANHAQFPSRGVVSENEVQFGSERADVLARLWDDRMIPIECKVGNSGVNSYKRLNHDTLAKYHAWIAEFGRANVMPSAILAGVYSAENVAAAQQAGLVIFWSHRLEDLAPSRNAQDHEAGRYSTRVARHSDRGPEFVHHDEGASRRTRPRGVR